MLQARGGLWRSARKNVPLLLPLEQVTAWGPSTAGKERGEQGVSSALAANLRRRQLNSSIRFLTVTKSLLSLPALLLTDLLPNMRWKLVFFHFSLEVFCTWSSLTVYFFRSGLSRGCWQHFCFSFSVLAVCYLWTWKGRTCVHLTDRMNSGEKCSNLTMLRENKAFPVSQLLKTVIWTVRLIWLV